MEEKKAFGHTKNSDGKWVPTPSLEAVRNNARIRKLVSGDVPTSKLIKEKIEREGLVRTLSDGSEIKIIFYDWNEWVYVLSPDGKIKRITYVQFKKCGEDNLLDILSKKKNEVCQVCGKELPEYSKCYRRDTDFYHLFSKKPVKNYNDYSYMYLQRMRGNGVYCCKECYEKEVQERIDNFGSKDPDADKHGLISIMEEQRRIQKEKHDEDFRNEHKNISIILPNDKKVKLSEAPSVVKFSNYTYIDIRDKNNSDYGVSSSKKTYKDLIEYGLIPSIQSSINDKEKWKYLENVSGIYGIFIKDTLVYIGQSRDIKRRWEEHAENIESYPDKEKKEMYKILQEHKQDVNFSYLVICDGKNLFKYENELIWKFCPPLNGIMPFAEMAGISGLLKNVELPIEE